MSGLSPKTLTHLHAIQGQQGQSVMRHLMKRDPNMAVPKTPASTSNRHGSPEYCHAQNRFSDIVYLSQGVQTSDRGPMQDQTSREVSL